METIEKLANKLSSYGDKTWRRRCADETGYSYQTVRNAIKGKHPNIEIMLWIKNELDTMEQLFI